MRKTMYIILTVLCLCMALTGCSCEHQWTDADCDSAKTCTLCGEAEGIPLGHSWLAATCDKAKTCEICGTVDGEARGHNWQDVTCETSKRCDSCGLTEGEPLGHNWQDATTEAPKTCSVCGATEGERIITDPRFTTNACAPLFGTWTGSGVEKLKFTEEELGSLPENGSLDWLKELAKIEGEMLYTCSYVFHPDGTVDATMTFDKESYIEVMRPFMLTITYQTYAMMGYSQDEIDALILDETGLTMDDYVDLALESIAEEDLTQEQQMLYYIDGEHLYLGYDWDWEFSDSTFLLEGDTLTILQTDAEPLVLTKSE